MVKHLKKERKRTGILRRRARKIALAREFVLARGTESTASSANKDQQAQIDQQRSPGDDGDAVMMFDESTASSANKDQQVQIDQQRSPEDDGYAVMMFDITDRHIELIKRALPQPRDCVINAMELLGIINSDYAAIMRIMVGETGVFPNQLEKIMEYLYRRPFSLRMYKLDNQLLEKILIKDLPISKAVFFGVKYASTGSGHIFIIGKNLQGQLIYLDPQNPSRCNLLEPQCYQTVFKDVSDFYVLKYGNSIVTSP